MTAKERADFINKFLKEHCFKLLDGKGLEYSQGTSDVNSNFKRVGSALGLDPLTVAYVYGAKHFDSITNYVKTRKITSDEPIEGRIADLINYLLIFACLIEEDKCNKVPTPTDEQKIKDLYLRR